jgi:hypothetical protein
MSRSRRSKFVLSPSQNIGSPRCSVRTEGSKFARKYQERFKGFESATIGEFSSLKGHYTAWGSSAQVKTTALRTNPELKPVRSTTASLVPLLPVQRFRVRYLTGPNFQIGENNCLQIIAPCCDRSRVDSFIYVDGAFRFIGRGAYPSWESCSTNDMVSTATTKSQLCRFVRGDLSHLFPA